MIKASELYIGKNYQHSNGTIIKLDLRLLHAITHNFDGYKLEDWHGIPITEEILLKCCFEKIDNNIFWLNNKFMFVLGENALSMARPDCVGNEDYNIPMAWIKSDIKHLHRLQNLYFALTGENLKLNL